MEGERYLYRPKQRVNVFLAVAFRQPVNCQFQGCVINEVGLDKRKKRLKRKYQNEQQQQTKAFESHATFAWVDHFRQREARQIYYFLAPLVCSTVAAIQLECFSKPRRRQQRERHKGFTSKTTVLHVRFGIFHTRHLQNNNVKWKDLLFLKSCYG